MNTDAKGHKSKVAGQRSRLRSSFDFRLSTLKQRRFSFSTLAAVLVLVLLIVNAAMMMSYHMKEVPTYDFLAFYTAGRILNEFGPSVLYSLETQRALHREIEPLTDQRPLWAYLNPPFVALLFAPLALMSYRAAYILMALVNLMLLIAALLIGTRSQSREMRWLCTLGTLATVPAYYAFYNGQLVCLLLLIFALLLHDLQRGHDWRAGVWLALLLMKPQVIVVPVLLLAWKRRFKTLSVAAVVAAALGLVSFAMVGLAGAREYWQVMQMSVTNDPKLAFYAETMHNWRGFFLRADLSKWTTLATVGACAATLALLFWIWRGRWQPDPQKLIALIFAALLVSPHCHWHDYVLIGLVFALLVPLVKDSSTMWLIAATFALASWASLWLPNNFSAVHLIAVASLLTIGLIVKPTKLNYGIADGHKDTKAQREMKGTWCLRVLVAIFGGERRFLYDQENMSPQAQNLSGASVLD